MELEQRNISDRKFFYSILNIIIMSMIEKYFNAIENSSNGVSIVSNKTKEVILSF